MNIRLNIRQPKLQRIDVEGQITRCGKRNFKMMQFFAIREDHEILRESYEPYFIDKFNPGFPLVTQKR